MNSNIRAVVSLLRETRKEWLTPIVTELAEKKKDPFTILISTIISLRTKDEVTRDASLRLFTVADTPKDMLQLGVERIAELMYPAGFYRNKAKTIMEICGVLVEKYGGRVPDTMEELLALNGVGRKTANLVLTKGFGKPGICVDTHVHRITNRLGYVATATPKETEFALREKLPGDLWIEINDILVAFGQNICKPVSPLCSQCPVHNYCERRGVTVHR